MNVDIRNYGDYRVTSHSGRRFDLYNRATGDVFSICEREWVAVTLLAKHPETVCHAIESQYLADRKSNGIDVT